MRMTKRALAGCLLAAAVVAVIPPATAGPKAAFLAQTYVTDDCQVGATCTHSASADGAGSQRAGATIQRSEPSADDELSYAYAMGAKDLRLTAPVPELRVSFSWRVDRAHASAAPTSPEGATIARVWARGVVVGCDTCVFTYEADDTPVSDPKGRDVVDAYAQGAAVEDQLVNTTVTHTVVMRGPNGGPVPPGRYTLRGMTVAMASVHRACNAAGPLAALDQDGCVPEAVGHAGAAAVEVAARLLSIEVAP